MLGQSPSSLACSLTLKRPFVRKTSLSCSILRVCRALIACQELSFCVVEPICTPASGRKNPHGECFSVAGCHILRDLRFKL